MLPCCFQNRQTAGAAALQDIVRSRGQALGERRSMYSGERLDGVGLIEIHSVTGVGCGLNVRS